MMEALAGSLASAAAPAAAVGLGWVLRRTRLLTAADGEVIARASSAYGLHGQRRTGLAQRGD